MQSKYCEKCDKLGFNKCLCLTENVGGGIMNNQQILDSAHILGLTALTLTDEYASLKRQIRDGLLLCLAGRVEQVSDVRYYVGKYAVTISCQPLRWSCDCPQGQDYGPVFGNFCGYAGRICKHIAAVSLAQTSASEKPVLLPRPASILELVTRILQAPVNAVFGNGEDIELPLNLHSKVHLANYDEGIVLGCGRTLSEPLANIVEGKFRMSRDSSAAYYEFYAKLQKRWLTPQTPHVETTSEQLGIQEATL